MVDVTGEITSEGDSTSLAFFESRLNEIDMRKT